MSGGHYDYLYQHINDLADRIELDLKKESMPPEEGTTYKLTFTDEERWGLQEFMEHLREVSECARRAEWFLSGDDDSEDFLWKVRDILL